MKGRLLIAIVGLAGCTSHPGQTLREKGIAIQPIEFSDTSRLGFVRQDLSNFYHCRVNILPNVKMPASFLNLTKSERYSADSILHWLSHQKSDSTSIIIGLTGKDIFITDKDEHGKVKEPVSKYAVWGILGLAYTPGDACVVSDARFRDTDDGRYAHRLRTIVIHEIGHNLGLPHCKYAHCIMNDANEHISTVDASGKEFCTSCQNKATQLLK